MATNKTSLNNSTAKHIDFCRHFCWCSGIIPKCLVYIVKHCLWPCRTRNEEKWHIHHVSILCRFYFFIKITRKPSFLIVDFFEMFSPYFHSLTIFSNVKSIFSYHKDEFFTVGVCLFVYTSCPFCSMKNIRIFNFPSRSAEYLVYISPFFFDLLESNKIATGNDILHT